MTKIYLIRHGITEWIEQGLLHGALDSPLSEKGRWQARQTALALKGIQFNHLYSSPQGRAFQTAEIIAKEVGKQPQALEGLREMDFGWVEGKKNIYPTIKKYPLLLKLLYYTRIFSGLASGESLQNFQTRVLQTWQWIKNSNSSATVLIVAHAGVLRMIFSDIYEQTGLEKPKRFAFTACGISEINHRNNNNVTIVRLNDSSHLK